MHNIDKAKNVAKFKNTLYHKGGRIYAKDKKIQMLRFRSYEKVTASDIHL